MGNILLSSLAQYRTEIPTLSTQQLLLIILAGTVGILSIVSIGFRIFSKVLNKAEAGRKEDAKREPEKKKP